MAKLISTSARKTKSFRGAKAFVAKSPIKFEDSEHESSIKKGEKFYLKELGTRYYLIDVEGKDFYQFVIDKKLYETLTKRHAEFEENEATRISKQLKTNRETIAKTKRYPQTLAGMGKHLGLNKNVNLSGKVKDYRNIVDEKAKDKILATLKDARFREYQGGFLSPNSKIFIRINEKETKGQFYIEAKTKPSLGFSNKF